MTPIPIAILDDVLPAQLKERPRDAEGLEIVWTGRELTKLLEACATRAPLVIVADLDLLGPSPTAVIERLLDASGAHLVITTYKFARRDVLESLVGQRTRALKAPVNVALLRTQMLSVVVRGILDAPTRRVPLEPSPQRLAPPPPRPSGVGGPRFTAEQLGKLKECKSAIECECPNHVAELLIGLQAFEDYSARCANRDDADARIHRMLFDATGRARRELELALAELATHEGIALDAL